MPIRYLILLPPLLVLAACAGPQPVADEPEPRPRPPVAAPGYPAYETFDPAAYPASEAPAPPVVTVVEHDVPAQLMAGTIEVREDDAMEGRVVQGFRIQLFTSETKGAADAVRDDVAAWWRRSQHVEELRESFEYGLQPVVVFGSPYYRVRVGIFLDRQEAQPALEVLRERYPEAFIVPDTITITRE